MPTQSRKLFIDSSIFLAFIDRADANHLKTTQAMEVLGRLGYQLYTSAQVINETYGMLARELGLSVTLEFLQAVLESDIEILFPQKADFFTAYRLLRRNRERQLTLREALNATLMQKRGIVQVMTLTYWHNLFGTYVSNIAV